MQKYKILYLSPDFSQYGSAFYQRDVVHALQKVHNLHLYGPGYPEYRASDSIHDILTKIPQETDLICVGHGWENQKMGEPFDFHPHLDLKNCSLPKVMILNKEYKKIEEKLEYIQSSRIDLVFTHHHHAPLWSQRTGIPFHFWPFAVNHEQFYDYGEKKSWDLSFTGILQNPTPGVQSDIRRRIKKKLFKSFWRWNLQRSKYSHLEIYWGEWGNGKTLSADAYFRHLNSSKLCLNTLSPIDLVGTRYYEAMASKSLVFCPQADIYKDLFVEDKHFVTFNADLGNFDEKLFLYLESDEARTEIVESAYRHVRENHTWQKRIQQFTTVIQERSIL